MYCDDQQLEWSEVGFIARIPLTRHAPKALRRWCTHRRVETTSLARGRRAELYRQIPAIFLNKGSDVWTSLGTTFERAGVPVISGSILLGKDTVAVLLDFLTRHAKYIVREPGQAICSFFTYELDLIHKVSEFARVFWNGQAFVCAAISEQRAVPAVHYSPEQPSHIAQCLQDWDPPTLTEQQIEALTPYAYRLQGRGESLANAQLMGCTYIAGDDRIWTCWLRAPEKQDLAIMVSYQPPEGDQDHATLVAQSLNASATLVTTELFVDAFEPTSPFAVYNVRLALTQHLRTHWQLCLTPLPQKEAP